MKMLTSEISITTTQISMSFNETKLSTGSAFFFESNGKPFLITNRHNLTGRNQNTGKPMHKMGGLPNKLTFSIPTFKQNNNIIEFSGNERHVFDMKWDMKKPPWLEHPTLGTKADLVALDLQKIWKNSPSPPFFVNTLPSRQPLSILPASVVSVVGYPFGTSVNEHYPIWITGSVASEPNFDAEEKPAFYIDCRTNKGASGSPVFIITNSGTAPVDREVSGKEVSMALRLGNSHSAAFYIPVHRFLGIYSGRINSSSDIGLVWREAAIKLICESGQPASSLEE